MEAAGINLEGISPIYEVPKERKTSQKVQKPVLMVNSNQKNMNLNIQKFRENKLL